MTSCLKEATLQAYHDAELPVEARRVVHLHLTGCARCSALAGRIEKQLAVIGAVLPTDSSQGVPTIRLEARIHDALTGPITTNRSLMESVWPVAWPLGWLAASALVIVGFMTSHPTERRVVSTPQVRVAEALPGETSVLPAPPESAAKLAPASRRHRARLNSNAGTAEAVTQFFALRDLDDMPTDGLRLIRIELPKSAMSEIGLAIDPELANTPIKADVILGEDGLARAIRFVR
jgi:hypothetical protein